MGDPGDGLRRRDRGLGFRVWGFGGLGFRAAHPHPLMVIMNTSGYMGVGWVLLAFYAAINAQFYNGTKLGSFFAEGCGQNQN